MDWKFWIDAATNLLNAPPAVIALVILVAISHLIVKTTKLVVTHVITREIKFGELKAIAVAHKSVNDSISPSQALREINLAIDDD